MPSTKNEEKEKEKEGVRTAGKTEDCFVDINGINIYEYGCVSQASATEEDDYDDDKEGSNDIARMVLTLLLPLD